MLRPGHKRHAHIVHLCLWRVWCNHAQSQHGEADLDNLPALDRHLDEGIVSFPFVCVHGFSLSVVGDEFTPDTPKEPAIVQPGGSLSAPDNVLVVRHDPTTEPSGSHVNSATGKCVPQPVQ